MTQNLTLRNRVTKTQCTRILEWLQLGKPLTAEIALKELGCARLAARIRDLRAEGHKIHARLVPVTNRYGQRCRVAEYWWFGLDTVRGDAVQGGKA